MKTNKETTNHNRQIERLYALSRGLGFWEVTFEGRRAIFKHEQGALYVAWLLLHPPPEPIHAVALALDARSVAGQTSGSAEIIQQRSLGLDDAETVRALRRQQHGLEAVLDDEGATELVKAEAPRELEEITEFLRKNPWRSRDSAQKCVRAVSMAIKRLHPHLAGAVDAVGNPHPVLRAFARHLDVHLLVPSGRAGIWGRVRFAPAHAGCFTYEPPPGVVWSTGAGLSPM